jgi:hypothetical protein
MKDNEGRNLSKEKKKQQGVREWIKVKTQLLY